MCAKSNTFSLFLLAAHRITYYWVCQKELVFKLLLLIVINMFTFYIENHNYTFIFKFMIDLSYNVPIKILNFKTI